MLAFVVYVDIRIIAPVLPSIAASLGGTPGRIGLAMTSYSLAYGTGQLVYGPLSDRYGRVAVIRLAGLGFAAGTVLSALAQTTGQFVAARLVAGSFAGAVIPLTIVYIGDSYRYRERQVVIGRLSAVTSAGLAFSAAIGGAVAHFVSWRVMLLGYAVVALAPVAMLWRLGPARPASRPADAEAARYVDFLLDRRGRLVYSSVFVEGLFLWGGMTYIGAFAAHRHGFDQLGVGLLLALVGVGTMLGGLSMAPIQRRLSEDALAGVGGAAMGAALLAIIPPWPWPVFAAGMLVLGLGFVAFHTTLQLRGTEISRAARGKAFSLFAFFLFAGIGTGTAVLGPIFDMGRERTMIALCALGLMVIGAANARTRAVAR